MECFPDTQNTVETESFPLISKEVGIQLIHFEELNDELISYCGEDLLAEFYRNQKVSYDRAGTWISNFSWYASQVYEH